LQHRMMDLIDGHSVKTILTSLRGRSDDSAKARYRRLADLSSSLSHHDWLWSINPAHGPVLRPDDYLTALRLRLGVPVASFSGSRHCAECNGMFTAADIGNHALLCARGKRTVGHNLIRDHLADFARHSDSSTSTEVGWATASELARSNPIANRMRPADILTRASALGGVGPAAIDVGVTTPHTLDAINNPNHDPLADYHSRKIIKYNSIIPLTDWSYHPFVISAFGRAHPSASSIIDRLARGAARSFGVRQPALLSSAWWRTCTTLLAHRAALMVHRCLPISSIPPSLGGPSDAPSALSLIPSSRLADGGFDLIVLGSEAPSAPATL